MCPQSSLTYLRQFQPDILKIDRSFIDQISTSRTDATLVSAVTAMAHRMGMRVIAEGVETSTQLDCICDMECDEIQGYLIAEPMSENIMVDWLRKFATSSQTETDNLIGLRGSGLPTESKSA